MHAWVYVHNIILVTKSLSMHAWVYVHNIITVTKSLCMHEFACLTVANLHVHNTTHCHDWSIIVQWDCYCIQHHTLSWLEHLCAMGLLLYTTIIITIITIVYNYYYCIQHHTLSWLEHRRAMRLLLYTTPHIVIIGAS